MDIGISTASLFMREYNEDALVTLDNLDARVVEVFLQSFSEYKPEYGKLLKSRQGNLRVHSIHVHTLTFETELFTANERAWHDVYPIFTDVLHIANMLGATCYTLHGRARIKHNGTYDDFIKIGKILDKLCDITDDYGVDMCLENVPWALYNRPGYFSGVKEYAPRLKGTLDIKQARLSGYDYADYIADMGANIKTVHLSDIDENGKICLPGRGIFDFSRLFERLKDAGVNADMLIEVYKDDYSQVEELKDSLDYLRELQYKIF